MLLQRIIHNSFDSILCNRKVNIFLSNSTRSILCFQCGSRFFSRSRVPGLLNYYERSFFPNRNGLFSARLRYYTSEINAEKKNEHIANIKDKPSLTDTNKINVKLKPSELRRLFTLAEPEKWKLTSKYLLFLKCKGKPFKNSTLYTLEGFKRIIYKLPLYISGAIGFLIISSGVTMAVPFALGQVLDIIYASTGDLGAAREKLDALCFMLCGVFLVGGLCNFGRVYLMSISGEFIS